MYRGLYPVVVTATMPVVKRSKVQTGISMLSYEDVAQASDWIAYQSPRHHAEVCDLARAWSTTPYVVDGVLVYVDDIEAHFERAQASGATVLSPLEDNPGVRQRNYRA